MNTDEEIRRGHEAERVLNEPMLREAFDKTEAGIVAALKACSMGDTKTQHELTIALQLLGRIEKNLKETIQTGKLAQIQKEALSQRLRRVVG